MYIMIYCSCTLLVRTERASDPPHDDVLGSILREASYRLSSSRTVLLSNKYFATCSSKQHNHSSLAIVAITNIFISTFHSQCRIIVHFARTAFCINGTNLALDIIVEPSLSQVSARYCIQIITGAHDIQNVQNVLFSLKSKEERTVSLTS